MVPAPFSRRRDAIKRPIPRKGQRLKSRKIAWPKPSGPTHQHVDPLGHLALTAYMNAHQRHLFYYRKADGKPITLGSQFGCLTPLKTFFKWCAKENHILYNPASELTLPKLPKHLPRVILSVQEVEAILREAEPNTASGLRDRAMLETLYSTALRRMELPGLALYDVDLTRRLVMAREGKGKRDRVVPIGERAAA